MLEQKFTNQGRWWKAAGEDADADAYACKDEQTKPNQTKPNRCSSSSLYITSRYTPQRMHTRTRTRHTHTNPSSGSGNLAVMGCRAGDRAIPDYSDRLGCLDVSPHHLLLITRAGRARRSPRCRSCPCRRGPTGPRRAPCRSSGSAAGRFASASRSPSSVPPDELHTHTHIHNVSQRRWWRLALHA
jgi:hypothetical protein